MTLIVALIALPPLLLGSVHTPTIIALTLACVALAGVSTWRARGEERPNLLSPLGVAAGLIGLWSLAQLIPLPAALLAALSPENAEARAALAPLLNTAASGALSVAPAATALAATRWLGLAAAALALATWLRLAPPSATQERVAALALTATGAATVVIGLAQSAFGSGRHLLGFIETNSNALGIVSGTFVNPNHAGTLLAMATLTAVGLALDETGRARAGAAAVAVLCGTGLLLNASRGALLGFTGGAAALAAALAWRHRATPGAFKRALPSVALIALSLLLAVGASLAMGWDKRLAWELARDRSLADLTWNNTKWQLIAGALELAQRFPLTGVGADAFPHVAPTVLGADAPTNRYTFVESDPPELLATLGVPIALLSMGLAAFAGWRAARPSGDAEPFSHTALGLGAALVAFVIHSGASFNIVILGLALPALAVAEVLLARRRPEGWLRLPTAASAALTCLILLGASLGVWRHTSLLAEQETFEALVRAPSPSQEEAMGATRDMLEQLPMDGHTISSAALLLKRAHAASNAPGDPPPSLELARRANTLAPNSPLSWLVRARLAASTKQWGEAAAGYRGYLERQKTGDVALLPEILAVLPDAAHRAAALPPRGDALNNVFKALSDAKRPTTLMELATELQALHPDSPDASIFAIRAAAHAGQPLLAELHGQQMIATFPDHPQGYVLTAKAMSAQDRPAEALRVLDKGVEATGKPSVRLLRVTQLIHATGAGRPADADARIDDDIAALRKETIDNVTLRARTFYLSGLRWQKRGQPERARRDFERAARLKPSTYAKLLKPEAP